MDTFSRETEVINEGFTTYAEASSSSKVMGTHNAQQVTVIEENGVDSYPMGAGFQWVNKNQLNPVKQGNFLEGKAIIIDPGHGERIQVIQVIMRKKVKLY